MDKCKEIKDKLIELLQEELNHNADNVTEESVDHVAHAIGSLAKAQYYTEIVEAMEDSEYGVDYDVNGRLYYPYYKRHVDMRDMDRHETGRMYYPYTDEHGNVSMRVREGVGEPYKMSGYPLFEDANGILEFFDSEMPSIISKATDDERNRLKVRMQQIANGIK